MKMKENETLISVIIPVYNAEHYIKQCLDSLLLQSFTNFELLLIDDGSTDGSVDICNAYNQKDCRVKVFHTLNGGPSKARNVGLKEATGKWIAFVDSDDWVSTDYLETLYNWMQQTNSIKTLVVQGYTRVMHMDGFVTNGICPVQEKKYYIHDEKDCFSKYKIDIIKFNYSWGKLFSAKLIRDNNIQYDDRVAYLEDLIFCMDYLKYVDIVVTIKDTGYYYRCGNPKSLSKKNYPVDIEYRTYRILKNKLEELKIWHNCDMKELSGSIHSYFVRVLRSLYYPQNKRTKQERISILKSIFLEEEKNGLFVDGLGKADNILLSLLSNHHWKIADYFYNIYIGSRLWFKRML